MHNNQSTIIDHYKYVVEHFAGYMYLKDLKSQYVAVSKNLAVDCGFSDLTEIIGKTDYDFGWKDMAEQFRADDLIVINNKKNHISKYLMPLVNSIGTYMMIKTEKTPVLDENNNVIAILGVSTDIAPDLSVLFESFGGQLYSENKKTGLSELEGKIVILLTLGKALEEVRVYLQKSGIVVTIETLLYIKNQIFHKLGINSISNLIKFYSSIGIDDTSNIIIKNMVK